MKNLITATECVNKLVKEGIYRGKLSYFIRLANDGYIPTHSKEGSTKRWYLYDEARAAVNNMIDPTREPQREANDRRRREIECESIAELLRKMQHVETLHVDMFDREKLDPDDAVTFEQDIAAHNAINREIMELTYAITGLLDELSSGTFRSSKAELRVIELLNEHMSTPETVRGLYGID
jgi:hypothetical protein